MNFLSLIRLPLFLGFLLFSTASFAFFDSDSLRIDKKPDSTGLDEQLISKYLEGYVPEIHTDIIKDRLACMQSRVKMTYGQDVLSWIKYYTVKNRDYTKRIIEKSSFYFPIFEEALKRHNMPEELKYLSIVESALRPKAQSWAAAAGLWQFIPATGKEYGLYQDWYIDERMDIYKSTDAACRYLKFLYNYHGKWHLALAAYNCGPGRVNWAVRKAGGKDADFWQIYKYLPKETRSYVPAFIGVCYAMNYAEDHLIFPKEMQKPIPADTILVNQFLNIAEFATQIDVSKEDMEKLNPHLKKNAIPAYKKNYPLRFPAEKSEYVTANRVAILKASSRASRREVAFTGGSNQSSNTQGKKVVYHTVSRGQSLSLIALKYNVSVANIRVWNRLPSNLIHPYQRLAVWVNMPKSAVTAAKKEKKESPKTEVASGQNKNNTTVASVEKKEKATYYYVQSGDTLLDIALKYKSTTLEKIKKINNINEKTILYPGQKILIDQP